MRRCSPSPVLSGSVALLLFMSLASSSEAFHLFRGDENGGCSPDGGNFTQPACCPASGIVSDDPVIPETGLHDSGPIGATVFVAHNSFNDAATLAPGIVIITAGQAVKWSWASYHCHSVTGSLPGLDPGSPVPGAGNPPLFDSGFLYPSATPPSGDLMGLAATKGIPGFLDYPIPDLGSQTLSYVHTFKTGGVYPYHCIHHQEIGMEGLVIVMPLQ